MYYINFSIFNLNFEKINKQIVQIEIMVLCFIALPIFLLLGIFSVKYRILARDAFECIGRTITFRKCKSQLDERIKSHLTGKIIKISPKFGMFIYRKFQIISIIFIILMIASLFFSITGLFNYLKYGNCYGPGENSYFCPYADLFGTQESFTLCDPELCSNPACSCQKGDECICEVNETCRITT